VLNDQLLVAVRFMYRSDHSHQQGRRDIAESVICP